eukprot:gene4245-5314_t
MNRFVEVCKYLTDKPILVSTQQHHHHRRLSLSIFNILNLQSNKIKNYSSSQCHYNSNSSLLRSSSSSFLNYSTSSSSSTTTTTTTINSNNKNNVEPEISEEKRRLLEELAELEKEFAQEEYVNPVTGEIGGPKGPEPTRYAGEWERKGRVSDF